MKANGNVGLAVIFKLLTITTW